MDRILATDIRTACASLVTCLLLSTVSAAAQEPAAEKPLPEIHLLMQQVEDRQRSFEAAQQNYLYRESRLAEELDGDGNAKKITLNNEYDVFWLKGVEIEKMVKRDGKELSPEEQTKENKRIDKEVAKARAKRAKADAQDRYTDSHGNTRIRLSEFLRGGVFRNERRVQVNGRDTILVDFTGDPDAKPRTVLEDMAGTLGIDETDSAVVSATGEFVKDFSILGGLVLKIDKGTKFSLHHVKINDEAWLDQDLMLEGDAKVPIFLLFTGHVRLEEKDSDYRKFQATTTILPGVTEAPEEPPAAPAPVPR